MKRLLAFSVLAVAYSLPVLALEWKPIPPEDLTLQKGRVDPAADAEALFWETWVSDSVVNNQELNTTYTQYLRVKIFTDRGAQKYGTVDLEYGRKERIGDVAARTIQPDGSVQEVAKDAIFDHVLEKKKRSNVHAISFAMPGVKAGSIIEYRWRMYVDEVEQFQFLQAQREIPCERVVFHIKPLHSPYYPYLMRSRAFNTDLPDFKPEGATGFFVSSIGNIPAFKDEEDTPPYTETRPWIFIYYSEDRKENPERFWKTEGKNRYNAYKTAVKVNSEVKDIAEKAAAGAASPEDKLRHLYEYCQKNIKNISGDEATDLDRQGFKPNRNTGETLKKGLGTHTDIELAFVALAAAEGFDARMAYLCDRERMITHREAMIPYLPAQDVAVNVNGKWRLYDPATRFLEPGRVRWQEEGVNVLVADGKDPEWIVSDTTSAADSHYKRTGQVKLDGQGALEGDLQEVRGGHPAEEWRAQNRKRSAQEREKRFSDEIKSRLPGAEVTQIKMSDPSDISKPVSIGYHLRVENYATRTGKRLFFAPAIFEMNRPVRYVSGTRKYDILMKYPWSETEDVSIELPSGYALDQSDAPGGVNFDPVGSYSVKIIKMGNRLLYHREFIFGKNLSCYFPVAGYPVLKKIFEGVHDGDSHLLTLKINQTAPLAENR
ncbi:MAG: DUF3857 domain-containing protein [Acidobacteriota bacterium]|nr:DUF3857 domain-containing protein [Acidobacteriota bacterium]